MKTFSLCTGCSVQLVVSETYTLYVTISFGEIDRYDMVFCSVTSLFRPSFLGSLICFLGTDN
jgi:hypothetical protein